MLGQLGARPAELLVRAGVVVTMDGARRVIEDGAVAVADGEIIAVGRAGEVAAAHPGARLLDAGGDLLMPGLVDGHTHLAMTLFRGLADDLPLQDWLERHVWPAERRVLRTETVRWGSRLGAAELVRSGVTTCCDMYFFADEVAAAVEDVGMRAIVARAYVEGAGPALDRELAEAEAFAGRWRGHARITPALGPHAPYTVGPDAYRALHALAGRLDVPMATHLAETRDEASAVTDPRGPTPVRHLDALGVLDERLVAAHCVWVDDEDIALLAARGTGVVHCPRSNLKLASGVAPVPDMLAAGVHVGLGTDGAASNNALDLVAEMQTAALVHKGVRLDPLAVPAAEAVTMATIGGARALGMDGLVGSLEPGKRADMVVVGLDDDRLTPLYDPVSHLAYAAAAADVRTVLVDGRVVMEDRRLLTVDEAEVRARVRGMAREIATPRRP